MLKLGTVYSYGLNDSTENKDKCQSGKECEDLTGKVFPSLPRIMQRDNNARHQNRKGQIYFNQNLFINQLEHQLNHDLPNASNHVRVPLSSIKKVPLEKIANHIQDFISEHNNSEYIQWYLISRNIIECKLYTEKPVPKKKQSLGFYIIARILHSKEIIDSCPNFVEQDDIVMVIYTLSLSGLTSSITTQLSRIYQIFCGKS